VIEPNDLESVVLSAQHRHESVAGELGLGPLLVVGEAVGALNVCLDDREIKGRLILDGHISMGDGAGENRDAGNWREALVHGNQPLGLCYGDRPAIVTGSAAEADIISELRIHTRPGKDLRERRNGAIRPAGKAASQAVVT